MEEFLAGVNALVSDEGEADVRASLARRLPRTEDFLLVALEGVGLLAVGVVDCWQAAAFADLPFF